MVNCSEDVLAFHNDEVTLPQKERTDMRKRRDANRDRLVSRLEAEDQPKLDSFIKQGSYAMLTMVQDPDNDYDIDDGAYFTQDELTRENGTELSPREIKEIVCDALKDDRFNKQPQVRSTCVRIFYDEGYHVDMPVYRIRARDGQYELADDAGWKVSRAADVEDWFNKENERSPDEDNGRQFRRLVRCIKKFARSRKEWKDDIATGFTITKLVSECYTADKNREDVSLRGTMKGVYDRLVISLEVNHPVTPGAKLTKGWDDASCKFLRDKLKVALEDLSILDNPKCSDKQALASWDNVFNTTFFSSRLESKVAKAAEAARVGILGSSLKPAATASGLGFPPKAVVPNKPAGFA